MYDMYVRVHESKLPSRYISAFLNAEISCKVYFNRLCMISEEDKAVILQRSHVCLADLFSRMYVSLTRCSELSSTILPSFTCC